MQGMHASTVHHFSGARFSYFTEQSRVVASQFESYQGIKAGSIMHLKMPRHRNFILLCASYLSDKPNMFLNYTEKQSKSHNQLCSFLVFKLVKYLILLA